MTRIRLMILAFFFATVSLAQDCTQFNGAQVPPPPLVAVDSQDHILGWHVVSVAPKGTCTYSGSAGSACSVSCSASMPTPYAFETDGSSLKNPLYGHYTGGNSATGVATSNAGGTASAPPREWEL